MTRTIVRWSMLFGFFLALSGLGYAQNEAIHGRVTDANGKAMPGVTLKATNTATGESEQAQSDNDGNYRIGLRTGSFALTATATGFGNASQTVDITTGDQPEVNFKMQTGGASAAVSVTSTSAQNAVTQQQVENLPSNGRNQIDLTLQAPRSDQNAIVNDVFVAYGNTGGNAQILMDGQQLTTIIAQGFGQAHFSKDAVEQLQMGDRFDATQGRSSKLIVQEVTKSGTNQFLGRASGYFRNDFLNSPDYITINQNTGRYETLPYQDQQLSFTFGGPIIKNKMHFFGNYEYERNPQTFPYSTPWNGTTVNGQLFPATATNAQLPGGWNSAPTSGNTFSTYGGRVDWQFRGQDHLMVRGGKYHQEVPLDYSEYNQVTNEPSAATGIDKWDDQIYGVYTRVISSKTTNALRGGQADFKWIEPPQPGTTNAYSAYAAWNGYPAATAGGLPPNGGEPGFAFTVSSAPAGCTTAAAVAGNPLCGGVIVPASAVGSASPANGFTVGSSHAGAPEYLEQSIWTVRDDLSHIFEWHGGHTVKTGGEWLNMRSWETFEGGSSGTVALTIPWALGPLIPSYFSNVPGNTGNAVPTAAMAAASGLGAYHVEDWNMGGLSQYATSFSKAVFGPQPTYSMLRNYFAGWLQDDWQFKPKMQISLGVRYDIATNLFGESEAVPGVVNSGRPIPKNAVGPRVGVTYKITPTTILRGGFGKYFADVGEQTAGVAGARENEWQTAAFEQYFGTADPNLPGTAIVAPNNGLLNGSAQNPNDLVTLMQQPPQLEGYTSTPLPGGTGNPTVPAPGSILANFCVNNNTSGAFSINAAGNAGCVRPNLATPATLGGYGWSDNANIGIQHIQGKGWIFNSDFYWEGGRHNTGSSAANQLWNPDGTNAPFNAYVAGKSQSNNAAAAVDRPYPSFGTMSYAMANTLSNYLGLTTTITRRVGALTGTATWTWSEIREAVESKYGVPVGTTLPSVGTTTGIGLLPFQVAQGYEGLNYYTFASSDQRNRANFNFVYKLPHGVALSGLYFFGSGQALSTSYGFGGNGVEDDGSTGSGDIMPFSQGSFGYQTTNLPCNSGVVVINGNSRTDGGVSPCLPGSIAAGAAKGLPESSLCAAGPNAPSVPGNTTENPGFNPGCLMVRDGFHPKPIDRVDMRLTKTIKMGERVSTDVFIESFNLLNHENFGTWNTSVKSTSGSGAFGLPSYNFALPFQARMAQFGFKCDFKL